MKIIVGIAVVAVMVWAWSQLGQACGDLEHTPLGQMDHATFEYYITNCQ